MDRYEAIVVTRPHPATQKPPLCRDCTQTLADNTRPGDERAPQCLVTVITLSTETKYLWAQIALSYCEAHWGLACNQGLGLDQRSSPGLMPSPTPLLPHHKAMKVLCRHFKANISAAAMHGEVFSKNRTGLIFKGIFRECHDYLMKRPRNLQMNIHTIYFAHV